MLTISPVDPTGEEEPERSPWPITPLGRAIPATVMILSADAVLFRVHLPLLLQGMLDEISHVSTAALILLALPWRPSRRFVIAMLAASVLLDIDHVPSVVDFRPLTPQWGRPYTHSFVGIAAITAVAWLVRRHDRDIVAGVGAGLAAHLFRDIFTGFVPLLWPFSSQQVQLPYRWYLVGLLALLLTAGRSHVLRDVRLTD